MITTLNWDSGKSDELITDHLTKQADHHLSLLGSSIYQIKDIAGQIKSSMKKDESLLTDVEHGFDKNKNILSQTMSRMDKVLTQASSNVMCYLILFIIMVLAILFKLTA